jgi:hypothetical protein
MVDGNDDHDDDDGATTSSFTLTGKMGCRR